MAHSTYHHCLWNAVTVGALAFLFAGPLAAQTAKYPGYPQQANIFTEPPFVRPDLQSIISPASPAQVSKIYGPEFASLPRLGVVLILVMNKARETPITVSRQTVRLTLPDGQVLKALEPSEMVGWLQELHGSALGKSAHEAVFGNRTEQERLSEEKGDLTVPKGKGEGSRVSWQVSLRQTPQLLVPVSVIVHEGQDTGFLFLALAEHLRTLRGFAADAQVVVSGKLDEIRVRYRADGKIIMSANLSEVDVKPRN